MDRGKILRIFKSSLVRLIRKFDESLKAMRDCCISSIAYNVNQTSVGVDFVHQVHCFTIFQAIGTFITHNAFSFLSRHHAPG